MTADPTLMPDMDRSIRQMLVRRSQRGTVDEELRARILSDVTARPQRRSIASRLRDALWVVGGIRTARAGRVLALIAVVVALILAMSLALGIGRPARQDDAVPSARAASSDRTVTSTPPEVPTVPPDIPMTADGILVPIALALPGELAQRQQLFEIRMSPWTYSLADVASSDAVISGGTKGIDIAVVTRPFLHSCPGAGGRKDIRADPRGLVEDLRDIATVRLASLGSTTIDGRQADVFDMRPSEKCPEADFHVADDGDFSFIETTFPARLYVLTAEGHTVVIRAWSTDPDPERRDAWLQDAANIIKTITFG